MQETQNTFIQHLIQNPHETGRQHIPELERLSQAHPASNFLHILLAKSRQNEPGFDEALNKAAIYSANRKTLFHLIHQPEKLLGEIVEKVGSVIEVVSVGEVGEEGKFEIDEEVEVVGEVVEEDKSEIEEVENVEEVLKEETPDDKSEIVNPKSEITEVESVEEVLKEETPDDKSEIVNLKSEIEEEAGQVDFTNENVGDEVESIEEVLKDDNSETVNHKSEITESEIDDEIFDEIAETPFAYINRESDTHIPDGEAPQTAAETGSIDEEIFDEIGEASFIDIKSNNPERPVNGESPQTAAETGRIDDKTFEEITETPFTKPEITTSEIEKVEKVERVEEVLKESKSEIVNPKSEIITSEIPSLESFHIDSVIPSLEDLPSPEDKSEIVNPKSEVEEVESVVEEGKSEIINPKSEIPEPVQTQPSRYHDEKMPYSFMWWLDKTRQEHAQTYQPYASPFRPDTSAQIETAVATKEPLEQQYIEHIFHLRSVEELEQSTTQPQTVPFAIDKKETKIIEKFIREEPQISTPRPEKLDVENKARKSTEDKLDMVSETLAKIYTEQMLYHKAIDTYQKLRLKYPDKSGYFAARIDELEQKIR